MKVYIREADSPSEYQLLPICTVPRGFLAETRSYEIEVKLNSERLPDDYALTLNDIPLDRLTRRGHTIFAFSMDFYAGDLRIAVNRGDRVLLAVDVQVDPDKAKLSRDEYAAMIAETARATLALYRLSAVTVPASATSHGLKSDLATLELIRTNFDAFERATSRVADQPVRTLRSTSFQTDILRARRVDDRAIGAALRSGLSRVATVAEVLTAPRLVGALGGRWIPRITETRRQEGVDVYENRALLGFLRWLDGILSDLARRLSVAGLSDVIPPLNRLWAVRISRWRTKLAMLQRRGIFSGLSGESALYATSVFRTHPNYASAFAAMSRMRSGLGIGAALTSALPLDKTYELYELWCYIGFLAAVVERFPDSRLKVAEILRGCQSPRGLGIMLASGAATEISLNSHIRLTYQRSITTSPASDGARTLLVDVVPDMTLSRVASDGRCLGIVILDAKYRAGASLLDGVRDMHVYRDAIVNIDGARLVKAAVALAPRPKGFPEVTSGPPEDRPGILAVRPGHDPSVFVRMLDFAIKALEENGHAAAVSE